MDIAAIKNFALAFAVSGPAFSGPISAAQFLQKLTFASVTSLNLKEGSYTPNLDYHWLWQNIPAESAPNFIFLQTPTALNLTVIDSAGNQIVSSIPVNKIFMLCLPPGFVVANIFIEGRAIGVQPMPTGVEVQYVCLMAQAVF